MKYVFALAAGWLCFFLMSGASAAEKIRVAFVSPELRSRVPAELLSKLL